MWYRPYIEKYVLIQTPECEQHLLSSCWMVKDTGSLTVRLALQVPCI